MVIRRESGRHILSSPLCGEVIIENQYAAKNKLRNLAALGAETGDCFAV